METDYEKNWQMLYDKILHLKDNDIHYSDDIPNSVLGDVLSIMDNLEHDPKESLKQSLIEMKLIREGKMKAITWDELYNKLKNEEISE